MTHSLRRVGVPQTASMRPYLAATVCARRFHGTATAPHVSCAITLESQCRFHTHVTHTRKRHPHNCAIAAALSNSERSKTHRPVAYTARYFSILTGSPSIDADLASNPPASIDALRASLNTHHLTMLGLQWNYTPGTIGMITILYGYLERLVGALRPVLRLGMHSITHICGRYTRAD